MKNKVILSFLIIPIIIACQNNNVNVSNSPLPSKSAVTSVSPTNTITPRATPTVNMVLSSPIPPLLFIDKDATPIIESNMQPVFIYPSKPPLPEILTYPDGTIQKRDKVGVYGEVYDENNNPIDGVTINIVNSVYLDRNSSEIADSYYLNLTTTAISGVFALKKSVIEGIFLNISAEKEGYTKKYISGIKEEPFYDSKFNSNNYKTYLTKTPEIQSIKINRNIVKKYLRTIKSVIYKRDETDPYKSFPHILNDIEIPKFKMKSIDFLEIDLRFNNSMIRETVEKNITIESLDKKIIYDKNIEKATFKWSNKDKNVIFNIPISKNQEDVKYRLYFKEPFVDIYNHKPYKDEYISLQNDIRDGNLAEISKNIVFEIEKGK